MHRKRRILSLSLGLLCVSLVGLAGAQGIQRPGSVVKPWELVSPGGQQTDLGGEPVGEIRAFSLSATGAVSDQGTLSDTEAGMIGAYAVREGGCSNSEIRQLQESCGRPRRGIKYCYATATTIEYACAY